MNGFMNSENSWQDALHYHFSSSLGILAHSWLLSWNEACLRPSSKLDHNMYLRQVGKYVPITLSWAHGTLLIVLCIKACKLSKWYGCKFGESENFAFFHSGLDWKAAMRSIFVVEFLHCALSIAAQRVHEALKELKILDGLDHFRPAQYPVKTNAPDTVLPVWATAYTWVQAVFRVHTYFHLSWIKFARDPWQGEDYLCCVIFHSALRFDLGSLRYS